MRSDGGSMTRIGLHVGGDWWTQLYTYADHSPILDIDAGTTSVSLCFDGPQLTAAAVQFARELASNTARFAAEVERMHGCQPDSRASQGGAEEGEAA